VAGYLGINEWGEFDIDGDTTFQAFDKIESGGFDHEGGEPQYNVGVGAQVIKYRGMVVPIGNVSTAVQTHDLLAVAKPAALGSLPPIIEAIQGGVLAVPAAARKQEDCYLDSVELTCDAEGVLMCDYSWKALSEAAVTVLAAAAASQSSITPVYFHTASVLIGGVAYKVQSWTAGLANGITAKTSQDAKTENYRLPEWFDPGEFKVNLSVDARLPLGVDMTAQFLDPITFIFTGTNNETVPETFTLDLTGGQGLDLSSEPIPLESGADEVLFRIEAESEPFDLDVWVTSLA